MSTGPSYADIFRTAVRDVRMVSDNELARLSEEDKATVRSSIAVQREVLQNRVRQSVGLEPLPTKHRLPDARLKELCASARKPGFRITSVPMDEWTLLTMNDEQMDEFEKALGDGIDAEAMA